MMRLKLQLLFLSLMSLAWASTAQTQTSADLILDHSTAVPGQTVMAGVRLEMPPEWHTYWRNPGDSGAATEIEWELPEGIVAGDIQWPVPEKYESAGFYTYVYHDEVVLRVPLTLSESLPAGTVTIRADVSWLECKETCIPGEATVSQELTIGESAQASERAYLVDIWEGWLPVQSDEVDVQAQWLGDAAGNERTLLIRVLHPETIQPVDFFPFYDEGYEIGAATKVVAQTETEWAIQKQVVRFGEAEWPGQFSGIIKAGDDSPAPAYEIASDIGSVSLAMDRGDVRSGTPLEERSAPAPASGSAATLSLPKALLFAFIGGLILNIMPCVLPVIAMKILGFVQQSKEEPGRVRKLGLVYGLGVLFSFLLLAGLVIGIQATGKAANWGMQFQNPYFLVALTVLVTLVALNLFGVFEVTLPGSAMTSASKLTGREGAGGAFFNGVLATTLATPCTAPFLAPALGFAFLQPPWMTVLLFLTIGLGLAVPYVVLSFQPGWLKFIPKPGPWMEKFKVAMGFPMLATALWLYALSANHFGSGGTLWVGMFLVVVGLSAWIFGQFVQFGSYHRGVSGMVALVVLVGGYLFTMENRLNWRQSVQAQTSTTTTTVAGIEWRPWSEEAVNQARAEGHPVLVDFTADWCVTCQANKATSIQIDSVREKLREIDAVTFKADYTRVDDRITAKLREHGRAGVPMVLVYSPDASRPPQLLPEVLTPGIVLNALENAGNKDSSKAEQVTFNR